jgi:hypothetical protein
VHHPAVALPKDAALAGLWPEKLLIETRECVLAGTPLRFRLVLEGNVLPLTVVTDACLVAAKDRQGYVFHLQVPLERLSSAEQQIIALFITKGRGSARIERL